MTIIEDTRNKHGQHDNIKAYCEGAGIIIRRSKLDTGDYILAPRIAVDTKQGMGEVYSNLIQDHERFRRECIRAQEDGTILVILVENDDNIRFLDDVEHWDNPRVHKYYEEYAWALAAQKKGKAVKIPSPPVNNNRLIKMMETMTERYGVRWMFCDRSETGRKVVEILNG